jgi:hypothetical protein
MNDQDKKLIFDYLRWEYWAWGIKDFNGNDILEAVGIMEEMGDMPEFESFCFSNADKKRISQFYTFTYLLKNFFQLLADWLKEASHE